MTVLVYLTISFAFSLSSNNNIMMVTTGFYNFYSNTQQKRKKALIFCTKKYPKGYLIMK